MLRIQPSCLGQLSNHCPLHGEFSTVFHRYNNTETRAQLWHVCPGRDQAGEREKAGSLTLAARVHVIWH